MTRDGLIERYQAYLACLNARDWSALPLHVHADVSHNGRALGVAGYRAMLERDVKDIPDLRFEAALLVCEPPHMAARLAFDCTPRGRFLGLPVDGRRVRFAENVFYEYRDGRVWQVRSVIDKVAIEEQLRGA